jgi:hypothetical protein
MTHRIDDGFEVPHAGWWVSIGFGLAALGVIAFDDGAWGAWSRWVTGALPRGLLQTVFVLSAVAHAGEAIYARRLARRLGLERSAGRWFWQTLALGFPSLRLLRRRAAGGVGRRTTVGSAA